jgi:hypothetical protein
VDFLLIPLIPAPIVSITWAGPQDWNPPEPAAPDAFVAIWRRAETEPRPRMIAPIQLAKNRVYVDAVSAGSTYYYSIQAIDGSGNISPRSAEKSITIPRP